MSCLFTNAINALNNMLGKPQTNAVGGRITIKLMIKNSKDMNFACRNIFLVIYQ